MSGFEVDRILHERSYHMVNKAIVFAKVLYEDELVVSLSDNPKRFRKYTRYFSKSSSTIHYLMENNEKVTANRAKAPSLYLF